MMTKHFLFRTPRHAGVLLATTAAIALLAAMPSLATALAASPKIAVLGGTGNLGRQTIEELLERGIPVRCLVRSSSVEKLPEEFGGSPLFEVVTGELLASGSRDSDGIYKDSLATPSAELVECLEGCGGVVACYGATRKTKFSDLFKNPEDTDPTHAKQINYRSMIALVAACKAIHKKNESSNESGTSKIKHIVRITGKGEDPNGIFSILLNGLGAYCKAWNYQGEVVLRDSLGDGDPVGYTIVRPGILKREEDDGKTQKEGAETESLGKDDLELADNGGNDLKVTTVLYSQIASLLVDLVVSAGDGRIGAKSENNRVTLAAMNNPLGKVAGSSLGERIAALRNDRREFPKSLVAEHKAAVRSFFTKAAIFLSATVVALVSLVSRVFF